MPMMTRPVVDQRDGLLAFLATQRSGVTLATYGLTDEQARLTPTRSTLSLAGLIKHLTFVEANWLDLMLQRQRPYEERRALYAQQFQVGPEETLAGIIASYHEVARRTEDIVAGIADLGQPVPVPAEVPWFPKDVPAWSVRWVLLHLIEETSRHAGHADLIREHIDGASAPSLVAAAEGWPESEWIKPWKPPD